MLISRFLTLYYYAYFLVVMPLLGWREKPSRVPDTISSPVLSGGSAMPAGALRLA